MEDWKNVRFCTETPWRAGKEGASGEGELDGIGQAAKG
jgi:hypothetical protein